EGMPIGLGEPAADKDPYHLLAAAQLMEAGRDDEGALGRYQAAITNSGTWFRPAALGTAHVGAGRCLVAIGRLDDAKEHVVAAATLLERWGGTRVEELAALERRLG